MQKKCKSVKAFCKESDLHYYVGSTGSSHSVRSGSMSQLSIWLLITSFILLLGFGVVGVTFVVRASYFKAVTTYEQYKKKQLMMTANKLEKGVEYLREDVGMLFSQEDNLRLMYGLSPIDNDMRLSGVGGHPSLPNMATLLLATPDLQDLGELVDELDNMTRQTSYMEQTLESALDEIHAQKKFYTQYPSKWPVGGRVTSSFGSRFHPVLGQQKIHHGIDIANKAWTPIVAPADGIVSFEGNRGDYGITVILTHPVTGYETRHAHMIATAVEKGQTVKRGSKIGYVGQTGRSTGDHLHYEVRKNHVTQNPAHYLPDSTTVVE